MTTYLDDNGQHLARLETQDLLDWARERTLLPEHFNHQQLFFDKKTIEIT